MSHSSDACRLRRAGVCLGERTKGYSSCEPCREVRRAQDAAMREERRESGACLTCGAKVAKDRRYCKKHLAYYAARDAARKAG